MVRYLFFTIGDLTYQSPLVTNEALQNRDLVIDAHAVKKLLSPFATWRFISSVDSERYCSLPCYRYSLTSTLSSGVHVRPPKWHCPRFLQLCVHFLSPCPTWLLHTSILSLVLLLCYHFARKQPWSYCIRKLPPACWYINALKIRISFPEFCFQTLICGDSNIMGR